jgi:Cys-tRNA(Pro)/Cys-tRNA(Cys) deacylase
MSKTNAVRILESNKIKHEVIEYVFSADEIDAVSVAKKINAVPETVFKTLVASGDKTGTCVFCVPGNYELDLKKGAAASGNKKIEMIKMKDLHPLTGYIRGGCSPIGMKKQFPTFIDESALIFEKIYVSAGKKGIQVRISPPDLGGITNGNFTDLTS